MMKYIKIVIHIHLNVHWSISHKEQSFLFPFFFRFVTKNNIEAQTTGCWKPSRSRYSFEIHENSYTYAFIGFIGRGI